METGKSDGNAKLSLILSFAFGVCFLALLLGLAVFIPSPTEKQFEIFRIVIAIAVAGVAAVVPGFIDLHLTKGQEIGLRAGGALAVFVVVYFYSPAHWVATPRTPSVKVGVAKSEHVYFLMLTSGDARFPKVTPSHSFVHEGGLSVAYVIHDPRLPPAKTPSLLHPAVLLPEGEVAVNFVVSNFGDMNSVVDSVFIDLIAVHPLPPSNAGEFLPALEPYRDSAILSRGKTNYPLFSGKVFTYKPGESDVLRIDLRVADAEEPGVYEVKLRVKHHSDRESFLSTSESVYLAKYFGGYANRNVYAKFGDKPPRSFKPLVNQVFDGIDSIHKTNLYTTGVYVAQRTMHFDNEKRPAKDILRQRPEAAKEFIATHLDLALLDKTRSPVEKHGFVVNQLPASGTNLTSECWRGYSFGGNDMYDTIKPTCTPGLEIYEGRQSKTYDDVMAAAISIYAGTDSTAKRETGKLLISASQRPQMDAAALIDILPLLAMMDTEETMMRVTELIDSSNALVVKAALKVLADFRFAPASGKLLSLLNDPVEIVRISAESALRMSADETAFDALWAAAAAPAVPTQIVSLYSSLVTDIDPGKATTLFKGLPDASPLRIKLASPAAD
jgi:hypothetical protein